MAKETKQESNYADEWWKTDNGFYFDYRDHEQKQSHILKENISRHVGVVMGLVGIAQVVLLIVSLLILRSLGIC